ncbi:hypothetical protein F0L74_27535 [Chitinophaga agrisoli]|uniref:VanZ like protein n=1 Tax=Chitinophaga agrisoli TaxID=2607653 RepID=A0A5B2VPC8_9BACT|nr:hypothetical protein [Chitinophaga agrisoli]KAA2239939.1 hypothetical protein F0L74_27535 [Chitinophaga agrisoli]
MPNSIPPDKWSHFYAGILIGAIFQSITAYLLPAMPFTGAAIAFLLLVCVSYGFELFSLITGKGHHDVMDAVATVIGGLIGMLIGEGFVWLLQHQLGMKPL